jgi:hypothetical protein
LLGVVYRYMGIWTYGREASALLILSNVLGHVDAWVVVVYQPIPLNTTSLPPPSTMMVGPLFWALVVKMASGSAATAPADGDGSLGVAATAGAAAGAAGVATTAATTRVAAATAAVAVGVAAGVAAGVATVVAVGVETTAVVAAGVAVGVAAGRAAVVVASVEFCALLPAPKCAGVGISLWGAGKNYIPSRWAFWWP